ncbi:MAG: transposase [Clostridia bacterium]|nr:transposase [Clostridia bacterium]
MLVGNNHQQIFFDDEDYEKFLSVLAECRKVSGYILYAYCLMGNHIHLLLKEKGEPVGMIMKRITNRYVHWYNRKYDREGHLFQGNYKSECVENENYFFTVIRYIHQNPVKAGLCAAAGEYIYSSFNEFFSDIKEEQTQGAGFTCAKYSEPVPLCAVKSVFKMIDKDCLYEYNIAENKDVCLEANAAKLSDGKALEIIKNITKLENPADLQKMPVDVQKECIINMRNGGLSVRQICRLTGVSFGLVRSSI